jgi:hypothetical protein
MLCLHFGLSLLSSALLGGTLSWEMPQIPAKGTLELMPLAKSLLNRPAGNRLLESPATAFSERLRNSPAPLDAEEKGKLPWYQEGMNDEGEVTESDENIETLNVGPLPIAAATTDPTVASSDEGYSYIYEFESPGELTEGTGAAVDTGNDDNPDGKDRPASAETISQNAGMSSVVDGTLGVLEQSAADLSVVFRNISMQISRLRGSF